MFDRCQTVNYTMIVVTVAETMEYFAFIIK
jgi:hypothetical protein